MTQDIDIVILAAGLGTRMRSQRAKVLHHLDGRPLIAHVVEAALELEPASISIVVGHQADAVQAAVEKEFGGREFHFTLQKEQRGTGDAVSAARELLATRDSTTLVLSGDVPLIEPSTLKALLAQHSAAGAAATILTVELENAAGYGRVVRASDGGFERIVEQKDATPVELKIGEINSGIYCFDTRKLYSALDDVGNKNAQGEYYLTDVPGILRLRGEIVGLYLHADEREIEGVNDRRQLASMESTLRKRTVERLMLESGVTFVDPASAYISSRAEIGRDTVIYQNVAIEGKTTIGEGCVIRPGVRITDSTIADRAEVRDNTFITDSSVGAGCTVGPMAHLRGQAVMADGSKVGNFVELKKTKLGKGSKASHLTYLGDATIGEETNIGAGTITCNYDGKNKHATEIGSRVRIGSDTMLVAPVKVGDNSATGAGSVVTKDVEANTLVVGAPARKTKNLK